MTISAARACVAGFLAVAAMTAVDLACGPTAEQVNTVQREQLDRLHDLRGKEADRALEPR